MSISENPDCFIHFREPVEGIELPSRFTFPFYYNPHPLSVLAVMELQEFLEKSAPSFGWEFGLGEQENPLSRGRMFGVLVVQKKDKSLGYLAAFSGNTSIPDKGFPFVPSINDFWDADGFYQQGVREYDLMSAELEALENDADFQQLKSNFKKLSEEAEQELSNLQTAQKTAKKSRDLKRIEAESTLSPEDFEALNASLNKESIDLSYHFKRTKKDWNERLESISNAIKDKNVQIEDLKNQRKLLSKDLQQKIYSGFQFLNQAGERKGLDDIFSDTALKQPPSGAGECAAPRLLQYAFQQNLKPIALAEFWWGMSSKSEIRHHQQYYPACIGKCQPILSHMLKGIEMDPSPLELQLAEDKKIEIIYEDDYLILINKPSGLLSVPGRTISDSVMTRMQTLYKGTEKPMVVHRLDMDTSGIMLLAKNPEIYKALQKQFIKRTVKKRYLALLEGLVTEEEGKIELPLAGDYLNRPNQIVCFEEGKPALTFWRVLKRIEKRTLIHFYPHTGRTHQLRVHAAHRMGLNAPIVGDDLYGSKYKRLCLHAEWIELEHPVERKRISFEYKAEFGLDGK
jgi:tRNA pseudouridine32 synthase / 23S rRNA pseudouridine746 synthase